MNFDPRAQTSYQEGDANARAQNQQQANDYQQSQQQRSAQQAGGQRNAGEQANNDAQQNQQQNATPYYQQQQQQESDQQANKSLSTPGKPDSQTRRPKVLEGHPILEMDDDTRDLLTRHQNRRASDREAAGHGGLSSYYEEMAKTNPTSASFDPSGTTMIPMPRGGLDAIVAEHLGRPPATPPPDATRDEQRQYAEKKAAYDKDALAYRHLLFRLNADTLRYEDQYTIGDPVRIFTEGL